jgi:filamentous hemagglutinin
VPLTRDVEALTSSLEALGGGIPRSIQTPRGARQFIFPNGLILRFDLEPGQYNPRYGPHINMEGAPNAPSNLHIKLR